jgi:hypothetical protein
MAVIFYLLGWIGILGGAGWAGYNLFRGLQSVLAAPANNSQLTGILNYLTDYGILIASPGLWMMFAGLMLLGFGGMLARLSEIAYNTRNG